MNSSCFIINALIFLEEYADDNDNQKAALETLDALWDVKEDYTVGELVRDVQRSGIADLAILIECQLGTYVHICNI